VEVLIIWVGEVVLREKSSFIGQAGDRQKKSQAEVDEG